MKKAILYIALFYSFTINAQEDKTVTLTVSGTGKTIEDAKTNALRSAIEQAFGAFISSKTEILNDNLVKDEIVSVANGNIQKFEIISQVEIPNNGYAMTLNATVSISKLTSFAQSKGVSIEIKGGLFAANIIQQELNEKAELISVENILNTSNEILKKSFDYSIDTKGNPTLNNGKYEIPLKISIKFNKNFYQFREYLINSLSGLSMSESEITNYEEIKKPIGQLIIRKDSLNFQEDLLVNKFEMVSNMNKWKVNINDFDENLEKVFYSDLPTLSQAFEIDSKNELKDRFKRWSWANYPDIIIYKVNKTDLGYAKIIFRNEQSLELINDFLKQIKNNILNFEVKNNINTISVKELGLKTKISSNFNISCHSEYGTPVFINPILNNENYFLKYDEKFISKFILGLINEKNTFPNILSILPLKKFNNNMILQFYNFKKEIVIIEYIDTKSLEELKQLSEYTIKPKE
jgi:hypothetical protein